MAGFRLLLNRKVKDDKKEPYVPHFAVYVKRIHIGMPGTYLRHDRPINYSSHFLVPSGKISRPAHHDAISKHHDGKKGGYRPSFCIHCKQSKKTMTPFSRSGLHRCDVEAAGRNFCSIFLVTGGLCVQHFADLLCVPLLRTSQGMFREKSRFFRSMRTMLVPLLRSASTSSTTTSPPASSWS